MPIKKFQGETFVAFTDISEFKVMMRSEAKAVEAIDRFYTIGYNCLQNEPDVNGLFVSDCGVLFSRSQDVGPVSGRLEPLLKVLQKMNRELLNNDIMLTTSVAYGRFSYHQRLEFTGIEKNPIYGNAYLAALLDNENGSPRIQPGECRVVAKGIEHEQLTSIELLKQRRDQFYFYWMVNHPAEIEEFDKKYHDSYQLKLRGMLEALKWKGQQSSSSFGGT